LKPDLSHASNANRTPSFKCQALASAGLNSLLYYANDVEYTESLASYYSADVSDVKPSCIYLPQTTQDVSKAIKVLNSKGGKDWKVAIKGGGHAPYASNNVQDGVTIDLGRLNSIEYKPLSGHNFTAGYGLASVGAGARWGDVYRTLEPLGTMVAGGREGHVGVGGLLLGGGFSWYSAKHGLAMQGVVAYEVVLADGSVLTRVSPLDHADLFVGLKGSLNNLGLVTRFHLETFPASDVYGGITAFGWDQRGPVLETFVDMVANNHRNTAEGGFVSLSWSPGFPTGGTVAFITCNTDGDVNSPSFRNLSSYSPLIDYRSVQPMTGLVDVIASTSGLYNTWYTATFRNTVDMARKTAEVFERLVTDLQAETIDEPDVQVIFVLSPLPRVFASLRHGLTMSGLERLKHDAIILQPEVLLPSQKYQALLQAKLRQATAEIQAYAKRTGQHEEYLYINYANPEQNPLAGYGRDNVRFLQRTARRYDPAGFFQSRVAGAFKVTQV